MEPRTFTKEIRSKFIENSKPFIMNTAEYFCNRPLDWSKDKELSVALIAFNRAYESQSDISANFLGYASALIHSALIQYYIKLEESIYFTFESENKIYLEYLASLSEFEMYFESKARSIEIALLSEDFKEHNIKFKNLHNIKFKDITLKNNLLNLILNVCKNDSLTESILVNKAFSLVDLNSLTHLESKIIQKYKKYIIMLLLIFSKDSYIYLKAFLNIRVGASNA